MTKKLGRPAKSLENRVLDFITQKQTVTVAAVADRCRINKNTASNYLRKLAVKGLVVKVAEGINGVSGGQSITEKYSICNSNSDMSDGGREALLKLKVPKIDASIDDFYYGALIAKAAEQIGQ